MGAIPAPTAGQLSLDELAVWEQVRAEVAAGHQAYVVCPLIEESEKLEVRSAEATYAELEPGPLAGLRLALLHGRMRPAEKEVTMELFRSGQLDVLVATTVIEVGVDVPNATVMVILDADRFGIAQLHQLRGRVGRGADQSYCYLVGAGRPRTPSVGWRRWWPRPTASSWPRSTSRCGARAPSSTVARRVATTSSWRHCCATGRWWPMPARWRSTSWRADPGLAGHADLLAEVELFLDEEDREYLERS